MKNTAWILVLALAAGCGGSGTEGGDGTNGTAGGEDDDLDMDMDADPPGDTVRESARELIGINPPAAPWSEMSHEDREMDMIGRFHPIFGEMFREHDAEEFGDFGCETCHGDDMRERNFEMPNPGLPRIAAAGSPRYAVLEESYPEMMRFMSEDVTPAMQTMLGEGATFTCNGCHPSP